MIKVFKQYLYELPNGKMMPSLCMTLAYRGNNVKRAYILARNLDEGCQSQIVKTKRWNHLHFDHVLRNYYYGRMLSKSTKQGTL